MFFQLRPEDYDEELLDRQDPVSFHKFDDGTVPTDPVRNYEKWFKESDDHLLQRIKSDDDPLRRIKSDVGKDEL